MKIVRTCEELKLESGIDSIAQTGFLRKEINGLHSGHIECIKACKTAAKKCVVSFFPHEEIVNYLFGTTIPLPDHWNENYCTTFCENNEVDIVFIPDFDEVNKTFFTDLKIEDILRIVNDVISRKGYGGYTGKFFDYIIAMEYLRKDRNLFPKDICVFSTKEGYKAFARKDYYETELHIPCILVDMTYRADGLPESSTFVNMSKNNLDILVQIYDELKNRTYEYLDTQENFSSLINTINSYDTKQTKTIYIDFIQVHRKSEIIGKNKVLIESSIFIDGKPESLIVIKEQL
jgi:pantothenate synthetase